MKLEQDLREFIELLNAHKVRYLIVGAYALAFHGRSRYTVDIDFFVQPSPENAARIMRALEEFGFGNIGAAASDFTAADQVIQLGVEPNRVDIMTALTGVTFDEAWDTRVSGELDGIPVQYISKDLLKRNKAEVGRKQDIADIDYL